MTVLYHREIPLELNVVYYRVVCGVTLYITDFLLLQNEMEAASFIIWPLANVDILWV